MKGEEHILVNFPIDTSLKKKAHSALVVCWPKLATTTHSSCLESLYIESEHSRLGIDRIGGAEITRSSLPPPPPPPPPPRPTTRG